jgi:hypothetical protein
MKETKLKPCPFCGAPMHVKNFSQIRQSPIWVAFCETKGCIMRSSSQGFTTEERAVEAVNTRTGGRLYRHTPSPGGGFYE